MSFHYRSRDFQPSRDFVDRRNFLKWGGLGCLVLGGCGGGSTGASPGAVSAAPQGSVVAPPTPAPAPTENTAKTKTQFGVNCYDLFYKFMWSRLPFDPLSRLKPLKEMGITLVRFSAGPFWPDDWKVWEADPEKHLRALDAVFDAADSLGMQLVPSVIWYPGGLSDHLGERYSAWGDANSASRRYMARHAGSIAQRYARRSSLLMWEFSNEMNSFADLPNGYQFWPTIKPEVGTFTERTLSDNVTIVDIQNSYRHFNDVVRQYDTTHPIGSGSHTPRENQIHGASGSYALDTRDQLIQAMEQSMVPEYKVLSVHLYAKHIAKRFDASGTTYLEMLQLAKQTADKHGAKLFLGEFGVPKSDDSAADRAALKAMIADIKAAGVDYATIWNYDWDYQADWSITATNQRLWMLDEIKAANA